MTSFCFAGGKLSCPLVHVHGAPGFVRSMADILEPAISTLGSAGNAELASMPDDLMGEECPLILRNHLHQVLFDLLRSFIPGKLKPPGNALHMGVYDYAFVLFKPGAEHDVGGFTRDTWQRQQLIHIAGNF